jgi:hypothetical protein
MKTVNRFKSQSSEAILAVLKANFVERFNALKDMKTNNACFEKEWEKYKIVKAASWFGE